MRIKNAIETKTVRCMLLYFVGMHLLGSELPDHQLHYIQDSVLRVPAKSEEEMIHQKKK